jgi:acetyl esterase
MANALKEPDALDPMIRRFVEEVGEGFAAHPRLADLSFPEARRVAEAVRKRWGEGGPVMAGVEELWAPAGDHDVRVRLYRPLEDHRRKEGALVYLHGGGWTLFSLDTHDRLMREYAARSGVIVVGVDYALSPEAKFPVALEEVTAVLRWLAREGPTHGVDPGRLAVGGDSAGANLAVGACLRLRDCGEGDIVRGMLLNYGVFQRESSAEAGRRFGGPKFMLSTEEMAAFWRNYLTDPAQADNPLASPILADLTGLPESFLAIAECDILAEQSEAMAARLTAAGVRVHIRVYEGATHSFLEAVSIAPLADRSLSEASAWLRGLLEV